MPAAFAAATPEGASSKTRQLLGSGGGSHLFAVKRKISGEGFPFSTASPVVICSNKENNSVWRVVLSSKWRR